MRAAKIISFLAFIFNGYLLVRILIYSLKLRPTFETLQMPTSPWFFLPFFTALIFTIGSLVFLLYLNKKETKGETVKFALWISIALLLIPPLIIVLLVSFSFSQPIYEQLQRIQ
jgi:hypothetical protein